MQLAQFPLAVPYLLNPVGIVGLMTISAEAKSLSVFAVEFGILVFVLLLDVVVFRWANRVSDKLDEGRMLVTEKVFGFLIAAIAVQLVLDGLADGWSHRANPLSASRRSAHAQGKDYQEKPSPIEQSRRAMTLYARARARALTRVLGLAAATLPNQLPIGLSAAMQVISFS